MFSYNNDLAEVLADTFQYQRSYHLYLEHESEMVANTRMTEVTAETHEFQDVRQSLVA